PWFFLLYDDPDPGHGIAIFVGDAAADDGRGQHAKEKVFNRLPGLNRENVDVSLEPAPIHLEISGFLHEKPVAAGHDVLNAEMAVGVGCGAVVSTLLLVFGDEL